MTNKSTEIFESMSRNLDNTKYITSSRKIDSGEFPYILCNPNQRGMEIILPSPDFTYECYVKNCNPLVGFDIKTETGYMESSGQKCYFVPPGAVVHLVAMPKHHSWMAF